MYSGGRAALAGDEFGVEDGKGFTLLDGGQGLAVFGVFVFCGKVAGAGEGGPAGYEEDAAFGTETVAGEVEIDASFFGFAVGQKHGDEALGEDLIDLAFFARKAGGAFAGGDDGVVIGQLGAVDKALAQFGAGGGACEGLGEEGFAAGKTQGAKDAGEAGDHIL